MPTVSYGITNTADDGTSIPGIGQTFSQTQTTAGLLLGVYPAYVGIRFIGVAVPKGATVTSATLTLTKADSPQNKPGTWGVIHGVAADNAPAWTTTVNPSVATKTSQSVTIADGAVQNYDVKNIVAAIVGRSGWASGNALAFAGDPTGATGSMIWVDYGVTPASAAKLTITYETGGGGTTLAADFTSAGIGSFSARGGYRRAANISAAGSSVASFAGRSIRGSNFSAAGDSNVSLSSSAVSGGDMSSAGSSSVAWSVSSRSGGSLTANGSSVASWASSAVSAASLNVTSVGSLVARSSSVSSASLNAEGVGAASFSGASISGATWIASGAGSFVAYTGASAVVAADWTAAGRGGR